MGRKESDMTEQLSLTAVLGSNMGDPPRPSAASLLYSWPSDLESEGLSWCLLGCASGARALGQRVLLPLKPPIPERLCMNMGPLPLVIRGMEGV